MPENILKMSSKGPQTLLKSLKTPTRVLQEVLKRSSESPQEVLKCPQKSSMVLKKYSIGPYILKFLRIPEKRSPMSSKSHQKVLKVFKMSSRVHSSVHFVHSDNMLPKMTSVYFSVHYIVHVYTLVYTLAYTSPF